MKLLGGHLAPLRGFVILEINVIGPISEQQYMGGALAKPFWKVSFAKKTMAATRGIEED